MVRIKKIGIKQTAKTIAAMYFLMSFVFILPMFLITTLIASFAGQNNDTFPIFGGVFILILPFVYALIGFVVVAIASFVYNFVAKRVGGVEVELDTEKKV